jgi:hypothetical protein
MEMTIPSAYALEDKFPGILSSSTYAHEIYYFHMNFYKTSLNLKFCDNVYLYMHYGCA